MLVPDAPVAHAARKASGIAKWCSNVPQTMMMMIPDTVPPLLWMFYITVSFLVGYIELNIRQSAALNSDNKIKR